MDSLQLPVGKQLTSTPLHRVDRAKKMAEERWIAQKYGNGVGLHDGQTGKKDTNGVGDERIGSGAGCGKSAVEEVKIGCQQRGDGCDGHAILPEGGDDGRNGLAVACDEVKEVVEEGDVTIGLVAMDERRTRRELEEATTAVDVEYDADACLDKGVHIQRLG